MFDLDECTKIVCALESDLQYPKELWELHNGYPLAPDKIEINNACCLSIT